MCPQIILLIKKFVWPFIIKVFSYLGEPRSFLSNLCHQRHFLCASDSDSSALLEDILGREVKLLTLILLLKLCILRYLHKTQILISTENSLEQHDSFGCLNLIVQ